MQDESSGCVEQSLRHTDEAVARQGGLRKLKLLAKLQHEGAPANTPMTAQAARGHIFALYEDKLHADAIDDEHEAEHVDLKRFLEQRYAPIHFGVDALVRRMLRRFGGTLRGLSRHCRHAHLFVRLCRLHDDGDGDAGLATAEQYVHSCNLATDCTMALLVQLLSTPSSSAGATTRLVHESLERLAHDEGLQLPLPQVLSATMRTVESMATRWARSVAQLRAESEALRGTTHSANRELEEAQAADAQRQQMEAQLRALKAAMATTEAANEAEVTECQEAHAARGRMVELEDEVARCEAARERAATRALAHEAALEALGEHGGNIMESIFGALRRVAMAHGGMVRVGVALDVFVRFAFPDVYGAAVVEDEFSALLRLQHTGHVFDESLHKLAASKSSLKVLCQALWIVTGASATK